MIYVPGLLPVGKQNPNTSAAPFSSQMTWLDFQPHLNSSFAISGIGQYSIFCTHPESLHLCACLSFFFLICPSLSSFWGPLIPPDPARCYPLWSYHPDHPGPSSSLLHLSSQCSLLTPPCQSLPHFFFMLVFFFFFAHLSVLTISSPTPPQLETPRRLPVSLVHLSTQWLSAQHRRQRTCVKLKNVSRYVSLAGLVTRGRNNISCHTF